MMKLAWAAVLFALGRQASAEMLPKSIRGFMLSGNKQPTLKRLNGGPLCTDGTGASPNGYRMQGKISLNDCASMAQQQEGCVGFRWGATSYNQEGYLRDVSEDFIDLAQLFEPDQEFECEVYAATEDGKSINFTTTELSQKFGYGARRLKILKKKILIHQNVKKEDSDATKHGNGVCRQRYSLLKLFQTEVTDLWFCFLPKEKWESCDKDLFNFYIVEGSAFAAGLLFFFAIISHVMSEQRQFSWALLWIARLTVNLQLGIYSVWFLVKHGYNFNDIASTNMLALVMTVVGSTVLISPALLLESMRGCHGFALFYLLILCFSPSVTFEAMSYFSGFPLLLAHYPMVLGLVGFLIEALKAVIAPLRCGGCRVVPADLDMSELRKQDYTPMFYTEVTAREP